MLRLVVFIPFMAIMSSVFAQNTERFYQITRRDGLASGSITSIAQDEKGLIWIGTKQGLNRYDGTEFIHFHTGNSNLTSNDISSLFIDGSNHLWVGTFGNGLHKLNLTTKEVIPVENSAVGNRVTSIHYGWDSTLLVLSNQGVASIDSHQEIIPPEVSGSASAMTQIGSSLWIGTNDGQLCQIEQNGTYLTFTLSSHGTDVYIQKIHSMDQNRLLIGTRRHGLLIFDPKDESVTPVEIEAVDIRDIIRDKSGAIWIGTDGHGIYKMANNEITNYVHQSTLVNSLVSNAVQVCFEDRDGNLWFGTAWDGISFIDRRFENLKFFYSDFEGSEQSGVLNIFIENNNIWLGTDGAGLSVQNSDVIPVGFVERIPPTAYVQFIDHINGYYWIGTFQSGFFIAEGGKNGRTAQFTTSSGLSHDDVRSIVAINDHMYLIATWGGGLNIFDMHTRQFRKLGIGKGLPKDVVTLHKLNEDEILVGTFGQGAFIFRPSDLSCSRILDHLQNVVSIGENQSGVWFGTWGEGLHLATDQFAESRLVASDDLSANANIFSILPTKYENQTWIATNERILRISADGQIQEMPFHQQQYHINASKSDDLGNLYFGGTDGVISFNPKNIHITSTKEVELLEVKILNQSLNEFETSTLAPDHINLDHDQNMVTFRYITPVYPSSRDEGYEVRLQPINTDWINVGRERSMTFADLNPGDYEFSVRNASSKSQKSFRFSIKRPWWKTWWAYAVASVLFLGLLYSFRRYSINLERIRNQLEIEKIAREKDSEISEIKQRFFVNISHEIRTPLTLIIGEIEHLATRIGASKVVAGSLNNLRNNGHHLIQLVNELLDFRKLDQGGIRLKIAEGNFVAFCREIQLSFLNKAEHQKITLNFDSSEPVINVWYDRDQLEKVFYNLLSNALKNTPAGGTIRFTIHRSNGFVEAMIEDSGSGIPENELKDIFKRFYQKESDQEAGRQGFGIGLSIVQDIVNLHQGRVAVESEESKGSRFIVRLQLGKEHFEEADLIPSFVGSESLMGYKDLDSPGSEDTLKGSDEEILVVEDNEEIREFIVRTLSHRFKIQEAPNGLEALNLIMNSMPDLIISDVMMPEMDGITLTRKLKRDPITSHIPIILLTARTGTVFKKEGFETGADDYITKPFSTSVLLARIENILKAREVLTRQIKNELAIKPEDLNLATPDERFLKDLVQVIQSNLDNSELNAEMVAGAMGMSHSVIYKKIKALTGYNLVEFIRDYRLQQASEILGKYKFTVAEACYKVGFSDKKYFSQIFKKKFGVTPSDYAKKQA